MKDYHVIGKNIKRVDAVEKVNGTARYCDDISFRNMLHAKMLHSPYAHARIIKIDTSSAERFPGVHAVITAKDLPENSNLGEEKGWMLAEEEVCYIGDPVAVVAAESLEIADKALKLIEIEYQQLPSVMYLEDALKEDAPLACPGTTTNLLMDAHAVRGEVEQDFSRADVFVSHTVHFPHILQGYLEPNSATAVYVNGELTVHCGSQAWHRLKKDVAKRCGLPENKVILRPMTMGGAFGGKSEQITAIIAGFLAMKTNRPVKFTRSREEEFYDSHPTVEMIVKVTIAADKEGHFLSRKTEYLGDVGAYGVAGTWVLGVASYRADTSYKFNSVEVWTKGVRLNRTPTAAYRGYGNQQAHFALETTIDHLAKKLDMDPSELRLKNYISPNTISIHGYHISSCGLKECMERAKELVGWQQIRETDPRYGRGAGCATLVHAAGSRAGDPEFPGDSALLQCDMDGKLTVWVGEAEFGQGAKTIMAQVVAEEFGIDANDVYVSMGDTQHSPFATGTHGSKLTTILANAVLFACDNAKKIILDDITLITGSGRLDVEKGNIVNCHGDVLMPLSEALRHVCLKRSGAPIIAIGEYRPAAVLLDGTGYGNLAPTYPFGVQAAEVEVDENTGRIWVKKIVSVHDSGKIINPQMAAGEVYGGVLQAFGFSVMEHLGADEQGLLYGGTMLEYKIPTMLDAPEIVADFIETQDPHGPYGAKSLGEPPIVSVLAAISNAVFNATGMTLNDAPFTPQKVLNAIKQKRIKEGADS
ncbi:xanthine dehydrogenase family protein molybdopterin-binding subunit [Cloacibacillus evryensis]|uniref:xanthine dehydrogenase family protein molybdopterin-binding subunit n=1 Tax=Cloacibacillus evryensis TaxID=508460 RepID=UPI002671688F|nr:xanthine dehydrogenase family protein molybdopterin-binding subunit [Cloacibacillus evryensis]